MEKLFAFILLLPFSLNAQKIAENRIDDFTHAKVKRTSWEWLDYRFGGKMGIHSRISQIDSATWLDLKIMGNGPGTEWGVIPEGGNIMLKMDNDSIFALRTAKEILGCSGCGATGLAGSEVMGWDVSILLDRDMAHFLSEHKITKIRVYFDKGYREDPITGKDSATLAQELKLML